MATPCQASAVVMSMVLTHEQRAFQIAARDFARDVIIPQVQAIGPSCPVVNPCAAVCRCSQPAGNRMCLPYVPA